MCVRLCALNQVRGLAHRGHWYGPLGPFFERFGAVKASPLAAFRLLSQGEAVLLYPGGGKEVCIAAMPFVMHVFCWWRL